MKIKILRTPEEKALGLQHLASIPDDTAYVFIAPFGSYFHSQNVPEPFDLIFMSKDFSVLSRNRLTPPNDTIAVDPRAAYVVEAKAGVISEVVR